MLQTGTVLDNTYEIIEILGKGGGGIVYKARHLRLKKLVAVKKVADNAKGKLNVRGEADILKNLHHTYLPQVYDFLEIDGEVFTVMDYIPGYSLDYYLKKGTGFTMHQVVTWSKQLCEAVIYLHSRKPPIIHRDIKPANIMITPEGNVCLIDFNISFGGAVQNYVLAISSGYSPPEQVISFSKGYQPPAEAVVNEQSDIYSLGATMYHMVTGVKPDRDWRKVVPISTYKAHVSDALVKIIEKAMALNPAERYQTAAELFEDLTHIKENDKRIKRIHTMRYVSLSAGIILTAGFLFLSAMGWQRMEKERLEKYEECRNQLYLYSKAEEYRQVISYGMEVLDEASLDDGFRGGEDIRADVEYMIANGYLESEEYEKALLYYEEAVKNINDNTVSVVFRDYAVALGRLGRISEAEALLEEHSDMSEEDVLFVRAELSMEEGAYLDAAGYSSRSAEKTEDEELFKRAELLSARAYVKLAQEKDASYYEDAVECCSRLLQKGIDTDSVYLNLASVYRSMNQYSAAETVLRELIKKGTENYQAYGLMAVVLCEEQNLHPMESRSYSEVKSFYDQAVSYFGKAGEEESALMENLEDIMKQLYEGGWL